MSRRNTIDVYEQYESLPASYHNDPRWKEITRLRKEGKHAEANGLVLTIRRDYGFEG